MQSGQKQKGAQTVMQANIPQEHYEAQIGFIYIAIKLIQFNIHMQEKSKRIERIFQKKQAKLRSDMITKFGINVIN